ncbi:MAG: DUF2796 domain-containing protein [Burkholderiaceae bacterium]
MKINSRPLVVAALSLLLAQPLAAQAQARAHQHGVATIDVAIDAGTLSLRLEAPLEALFGFERAPRSDAERKAVQAVVARLNAADVLFRPDTAAGCTLERVELTSAVLKIGHVAATAPRGAEAEHADLESEVEFSCKQIAKLAGIDIGLFEAFAFLQRIDVQIATPKGQFKRSLKRPQRRIALLRE